MASSYVEGHRHAVVTADDQGPVLQIVAWFLMVVMILATLLKCTIRTAAHGLGLDDLFVSIAMLFGVGEVVAISMGVNHGLGTRARLLNNSQIDDVEHSLYTSSLLYLFTLAFAKASIILLMSRLFVEERHVKLNRILSAAVLAWTVAAVFGAAFQCGLPHPWDDTDRSCPNSDVFWYIIGTFDILTDLACIVLPAIVIRGLQMDSSRKTVVMSAFALRLIVVAAQNARLVFISQHNTTFDPTHSISLAVATQIQTSLAVVVSCAPALKPYLDRAASGLMGVSLEQREGTYNVSGSHQLRSLSKQGDSNNDGAPRGSRNSRRRAGSDSNFSPDRSNHRAMVSSRKGTLHEQDGEQDDASDKYIIRKTTAYEVMYSEDAQPTSSQPRQSDGEANISIHKGHRAYNAL